MWLLVLLLFSLTTTLLYYVAVKFNPSSLAKLALISWGATIMFTVDAVFSYLEGEEPIEFSWSALQLSGVLVAVIIAIWLLSLVLFNSRKQ
jgi:hypothetical protein